MTSHPQGTPEKAKHILPIIVLSQFFCTSLWFAGNAIMPDLVKVLHVGSAFLAQLTSFVQFGFILGTLLFALFGIADRFSAIHVFFLCAITAAVLNLGICLPGVNMVGLLTLRFLTGFFLAGIYPVGMKIAANHNPQGVGRSLGFLVGALVLGTAFPHFLKSIATGFSWRSVVWGTSALAAVGGIAMRYLVQETSTGQKFQQFKIGGFLSSFQNPGFRAAAFGYWGHMWELYAFWVYVPLMLTMYQQHHPMVRFSVPWYSFFIIAAGAASCVASGLLSRRFGSKKVAVSALLLSCMCCFLSPLFLLGTSFVTLLGFLLVWSMTVISDSPQFSALVAHNAPPAVKGTALTMVNCIGFSITIISIQLISLLRTSANAGYVYVILALGPVVGLLALMKKRSGQALSVSD